MSGRAASVAVDLVLLSFVAWALIYAFGDAIRDLHRRRCRAVRVATRPTSPTVESKTVTVVPPQRRAS